MQTKKQSLVETLTNISIGMILSILVQLVVYPIMGIKVQFYQNVTLTVIFTIVSIVRGYLVRRFFNKKHN